MPEIKIKLTNEIHEKLKEYAKEDDRSLNKYITRGLEYLANMPTPYHRIIGGPGVTPTPLTQQPFIYIPENPVSTPMFTNPTLISDTSQMTGLEQQEYARKQAAEAKTKLALEKQEARTQPKVLSPEEEQLQKQKLELQKQKIQEKRDSLIRDKAIELDLEDAEDYNEDRLLDEYFGMETMICANYDEKERGIPNPYKNKSIDELYKYMSELKQIEIKEKEEEDRRDALPHDIDDYDYKSEDFIEEINRLQGIWIERGYGSSYDDEDFNILFNYYFRKGLYHNFEERMNHPYYAFSDDDMQDLQNAFNRTDIDIDYINALMCGDGHSYRSSHNKKSYFEEHQEERAEWQRIIDESKKKRTEI